MWASWCPPSSTMLVVATMKPFFSGVIIELRAGIGMGNRDLDGFNVELLGKVDRVADRSWVSPGRPKMKSP